jgi:hypothetical protein
MGYSVKLILAPWSRLKTQGYPQITQISADFKKKPNQLYSSVFKRIGANAKKAESQ